MALLKKLVLIVIAGTLIGNSSLSSFARPILFLVSGGGAAYMANKAYEEYTEVNNPGILGILNKQCTPFTKEDFTWENRGKLQEKCLCYKEKYEKVIPKAAVALVLASGAAAFLII
jgi:hypothetical protein